MKNITKITRQRLADYYLLGVLLYPLIAFAWQRLGLLFNYKNVGFSNVPDYFIFSVLIILIATTLKQWQPNLRIPSWALLIVGWLLEIKIIISLDSSILATFTIDILLLTSLAMSCWSTFMFFIGFDINKYRSFSKKLTKYYFVTALIFVGSIVIIARYYLTSFLKIASSGSLFVAGGINHDQMEKLIDDKIWQADIFMTVLTILTAFILGVPYRKILNSEKMSQQRER